MQAIVLYTIIKQNLSYGMPDALHLITILGNMTRYSAIFKNRSFRAEQEKRIIYYFADQHIDQFDENFLSGPYDYECKGTKYYRFELSWFSDNSNHAITKIFLGPKCQLGSAKILKIFGRLGVQINENQILKSESSYR